MEENKEKAILQAAEEEFFEKGFDGARTVSIAQKAGVTHAMLHYYFRSKEQLFRKILDEKMAVFSESVLNVFSDTEKPLLERLEEGIRRHFDFLSSNPGLPAFILRELDRINLDMKELLSSRGLPIIRQTQQELDASRSRCWQQAQAQHCTDQSWGPPISSTGVSGNSRHTFPASSQSY